MQAELKSLEEKVAQIARMCQQLRAENMHLRQQLATAQNQSKLLGDKITGAQSRLEALMEQIPESAE
jgi:cell division protein ZapB